MSKAKKLSLPSNDSAEFYNYKPKDLIWAKMKGFTPWPAMIVEPSIDLLNQPRKANTKSVFFFGTRNFAWIETNNIKPFEGPWKTELAKVNKPNSFRHAMADINAYIEDPTEIDAEITKNTLINHSTEADFDKIRDGLTDDDATNDARGADDGDMAVGTIAAEVAIESDEIPPQPYKTPIKRTPKAKSSAVATVKARSSVSGAGNKSTKRRRSSQVANSSAKRKRNSSVGALEDLNDYINRKTTTPPSRRKINADVLAHISSTSRRNVNAIALLDRPVVSRPEAQAIDMNARSQTLAERDITPSHLTFGFLGLGIMGSTIVKDLLCTGHKVVVWNRTMLKCTAFAEAGAEVKGTPMDVVEASDVIFCCVSDPKASKDLVFGNCGVLGVKDMNGKAYVEMSTIDPETSQDIAEGIQSAGGRYLEVQIHGTRQEAEDGMLIILAGGDRSVFEDCHSCFKTIAKNTFFLGEVGNACKVNLILQTIVGVSLVGLAEALALADRFSISLKDIIDIFELTSMKSQLLLAKGKEMAKGDFNPQHPLSHMQKDLRLVLSMAENLDQSMPVTAITNEVFKHTKRLGYSEHDSSAVFQYTKNADANQNGKLKDHVISSSTTHGYNNSSHSQCNEFYNACAEAQTNSVEKQKGFTTKVDNFEELLNGNKSVMKKLRKTLF
ncbi:cytokine-like nuclear factor N-PAC isoform X2 [Eurosta solidaginis]|uniref:cytokine-like nuclear factor N-PAC isoform X2 n=1 Tax=Eurosta solidaginis TaxID=178769 RepID=UPI003531448A